MRPSLVSESHTRPEKVAPSRGLHQGRFRHNPGCHASAKIRKTNRSSTATLDAAPISAKIHGSAIPAISLLIHCFSCLSVIATTVNAIHELSNQ